MKYLIAPIWFASFFENESVLRTSRETRCRRVQLNRSTPLVSPDSLPQTRCRSVGMIPLYAFQSSL